MGNNKVTVIGSINYDIILKQKRLPEIGETFSADSITFCGGGKGANQAVQCAKLGLKTFMVGKVGEDNFGKELLIKMKSYGVHVEHISSTGTNTGIGIVNSIEDGSLVATIAKGANYSLSIDDIDQAESLIQESKIIILQLEIPKETVEHAIQVGKKNGCYIILNAAPAAQIDSDYLEMVDCLVVNEVEASFYAEEKVSTVEDAKRVCKKLRKYANHLLVITLGEKGSLIYDGTNAHHFGPVKVNALETTGAGDSYIGALAYMIMHNKSIQDIGQFASLASSITVTRIGAQDAMPTLEEILSS